MKTTQRLKSRNRITSRLGATAVEMAFVAPAVFLLFFGGLEFSRANTIINVADNAAFEGARIGIVPGASAADCQQAAEEQLDILRVKGYEVEIQPSTITQNTTEIQVTVTVPMAQNALPLSRFVAGKTLMRSVTLNREVEE